MVWRFSKEQSSLWASIVRSKFGITDGTRITGSTVPPLALGKILSKLYILFFLSSNSFFEVEPISISGTTID